MLILHLGREAAGLEQTLAVPVQRLGISQLLQRGHGREACGQATNDIRCEPLVDEVEVATLQNNQFLQSPPGDCVPSGKRGERRLGRYSRCRGRRR